MVGGESLLSSAGGSLLVQTAAAVGLDRALSVCLAPWRARHDPGKVVLDLAVAIALGGDCLADLAVVGAAGSVRSGRLRCDGVAADRDAGR